MGDATVSQHIANGSRHVDVRLRPERAVDVARIELHRDFLTGYSMLTDRPLMVAVNRGEREGVLKVKLEGPDDELVTQIQRQKIKNPRAIFTDHLRAKGWHAWRSARM